MPQKIGELINNLALKAGVPADNAELKALLSSEQLATIEVPDELVSSFDKGLLNIDAAKNNHPDIKKKYFADAYDGIDKQLIQLIEADTFDEADVAEIKAEKSTSKKQEMIISKLRTAAKNAKPADKEAINQQLAAANKAALDAKNELAAEKTNSATQISNLKLQYAKKAVLASYKTIYDELDGGIKLATMEAIIDKALQDKNAVLEADEHGNIKLVGKDGTNVFGSNNVQLTAQSFLDQSLAPILKVSGTPPAITGELSIMTAKIRRERSGLPFSEIRALGKKR
jgi:hypothetical protein